MAGNRLGGKLKYVYYTNDVTVAYILRRDTDLVFAGLGDGAAAPELFDPASPPAGVTLSPAPKGFSPRVVFAQAPDGARKDMICFHPNSDIFKAQASQTLPSIDGDATFVTTGYKGEQLSF